MKKVIGQDFMADEPVARRLLSVVYQRYPSTVRNVGITLDLWGDSVQELLHSFSAVRFSSSVRDQPF